jgi:hypothetical protein
VGQIRGFRSGRWIYDLDCRHAGGCCQIQLVARISLTDKLTGKEIRRKTIKCSDLQIFGVFNQNIWVRYKNTFTAFKVSDFTTIFDEKALFKQIQESGNTKITEYRFNEPQTKVFFLTSDAYQYSLDCPTLTVSRENYSQEDEVVRIDKKVKEKLRLFALKSSNNNQRTELYFHNTNVAPNQSYIKASILYATTTDAMIVSGEPKSVFILHYESLEEKAEFSITRATADGKSLWTVRQKELNIKRHRYLPTEIKYVELYQNLLIIICSARRDRVLALNIDTGLTVWNHTL